MALHIELRIGDHLVGAYGVQRQEPIEDHHAIDRGYTYLASKYVEIEGSGDFRKSDNIKLIRHRYCDGADLLAEKVLHAFNHGAENTEPKQPDR